MPIAKFTTCLWFNDRAEEAAQFYTSVFKDGKITHREYYSDAGKEFHGHEAGSLMVVEWEMNGGQKFVGLNGGDMFKFSEAISFMIDCDDQDEIDYYWGRLGEGGDTSRQQCGWLGDKFGVAWQICPKVLKEMMGDPDKEKADRVTNAMMQMKKMDIQGLRKAFEGK